MPNKGKNWFTSIPATRWAQAGLVLLGVYIVEGIVLANYPNWFEPLKLLFAFALGPLGVLVWAMALWRVLIETLENA